MSITIEKLPSGFYCVWVNGKWVNAACSSLTMAKAIANDIINSENERQNKQNLFTNISLNIKSI